MAAQYGGRRQMPISGIEERVMATLAGAARTAGRTVPRMDQAAYLAAREICRALPSTGPPSSTVVEFSLRSQGIIDPPPHMVIANLPVGLEDEVLDQLA